MRNKLLICGDSFTATDTLYDWAWYCRIANDLDAEIINLSIVGASNFNIWHQVAYAKKNIDFDMALVCLTRPNRVEKVLAENLDAETCYTDFTNERIKSWAIHEYIENGDYPFETMEKFSPMSLAVSKDRIIANDIVSQLSDHKSCIINNLFTEYTNNVEDINIRAYSDVETGVIPNENEVGHLYESMHSRFYNTYSHRILTKLN
jgi:hypothetical protein